MAVTEDNLDVGSTGEKLDTTTVEQTDGTTAHREAVVLTDAEDLAARAAVNQHADSRDYGVQVVNPQDLQVIEGLSEVIVQLKIMNFHLSQLTDTTLTEDDFNGLLI